MPGGSATIAADRLVAVGHQVVDIGHTLVDAGTQRHERC